MHAWVVNKYKLIILWSAKCGCSTVKSIIYKYLGQNHTYVHKTETYSKNIDYKNINKYKEYTIIWIIRNPYHRVVSGFVDKYCYQHVYKLPKDVTNFDQFIKCLHVTPKKINYHHFTPQTSSHINKRVYTNDVDNAYNIDTMQIVKKVPKKLNFYNEELKKLVEKIYKDDFREFKKYGFNFNV